MTSRKRISVPAAICILSTLLVSSTFAQESRAGTYTKIPTIKGMETLAPGTPAPVFTVRDLQDREFRLKDYGGRESVLLFFWSFFCGPCREEIPLINQVAKDYKDKGLHVVGVNLDGREMKKAIDKYVAAEKIGFSIVFDELKGDAFTVADPYGVAGTPALFLIDRKGTISFSLVGAITADKLRKEVDKVVK